MTYLVRTSIAACLIALFSLTASAEEALSPETVAGATTVDGATAKKMFDQEVAFIDVRKNSDWGAGRIPGAIHIELKKVYSAETLGAEIKKDEPVVIYCNGPKCMRSSKASAQAVKWGFSKVYYYREGLPDWRSRGFPVE